MRVSSPQHEQVIIRHVNHAGSVYCLIMTFNARVSPVSFHGILDVHCFAQIKIQVDDSLICIDQKNEQEPTGEGAREVVSARVGDCMSRRHISLCA